jgi:hypothetical protein
VPRRLRAALAAAGTATAAFLTASVGVAWASGWSATVASSSTFSSGTLQLEATTSGPSSCYSTGSGTGGVVSSNSAACTAGSPLPSGELTSTATSQATTTLSSPGTVDGSSAVVASTSCGTSYLEDTAGGTAWTGTAPFTGTGNDTALPIGGVTYGGAGPLGGQAISLDGSSGWAETTVGYNQPQDFTVLVWFKTPAGESGPLIGFSGNQTDQSPRPHSYDRILWVDPSGHVVWAVWTSTDNQISSSSSYADGQWHFAAASIGTSGQFLYVDGAQVASGPDTLAQATAGWWALGASHVYLSTGYSDVPTNEYFDGSLAQVAVIPSQLSSSQISALYADNTLSSYTAGVQSLSPVDYWPLDDTGTTAYEGPVPSVLVNDASGGGDTATAEGGVTLRAGGGPLGGLAAQFDGSTGYLETATAINNPEGFSEVAWFKTTSASGGTVLGFSNAQDDSQPTDDDRGIWLDDSGNVVFGVNSGTGSAYTATTSGTYNDGAWHMVVAEIGSSGMQLYVDGTQLVSSTTPTSAWDYAGWWHIGWSSELNWANAPTSYFFSGSLSEIAVIPSQLSSAQVSALYGAGSTAAFSADIGALGPSEYWPLQDGSNTTVVDASGNANTGRAWGGVTLGTSGPLTASAMTFDGSTGSVKTTTSISSPPNTFSEVAWFKTTASTGGTVLGFDSNQGIVTSGHYDRSLWVDNSGRLVFALYPNNTQEEAVSTSAYNDGKWHMMVASVGASGQELFVDGSLVAANAGVSGGQSYTGYWHLGWDNEGQTSQNPWADAPTDAYFQGSIAEVAIIGSQLSAPEVSALYDAGTLPAFTLDIANLSPSYYWPLQDSASDVCGTAELTVQEAVGGTTSCIYPVGTGSCPVPSSSYLVPALGEKTATVPTAGGPATLTFTMELASAPVTGTLGLQLLPGICFGTALSPGKWTAQVAYPGASAEL